MSSAVATALGTGAILLWATLASLTALRGPIPPFQTTAIVFLIALFTNKDKIVLFIGLIVGAAIIGSQLLFGQLEQWLVGGAILIILLTMLARDPAHGGAGPESYPAQGGYPPA